MWLKSGYMSVYDSIWQTTTTLMYAQRSYDAINCRPNEKDPYLD